MSETCHAYVGLAADRAALPATQPQHPRWPATPATEGHCLCCSGAKIVRLDAFGYVTKEPGTRCFFQEPEVWKLLDMVEKIVHDKDTGCASRCDVVLTGA